MMSKKSPLLCLIAVLASLFIVSCGSMKNTATVRSSSKSGGGRTDTRTFEIPKSLPPQSNALLTEAKKWIGTPYKYGGEDKRGIDCSGLVLNVYKSALDIKLPRNSGEQANYCSPLQKNQLMPGDLIFFATGSSKKRVSHVGIYVGDGRMIHSSASSGVVVSDIESDYFVRTYAGSGCVEKYRAMISDNTAKNPVKSAASSPMASVAKPSAPTVKATPVSAATATATKAGETLPYKMTPVTSLPKKNVATGSEPKATESNTSGTEETIPMPVVKSTQTIATVKATPVTANASASTSAAVTVATSQPAKTEVAKNEPASGNPANVPGSTTTPQPTTTPAINVVTPVNAGKKSEPTASEARNAVLNSLKEKKMDSPSKK